MRVLVTRPAGKGEKLLERLKSLVDAVYHQPMINILPGPDGFEVTEADVVIFVSTSAVKFATLPMNKSLHWQNIQWLAVGKATAEALQQKGIGPVLYPELETSEGLLALNGLQQAAIAGKKVQIVRGVGGRELLAETLKARGAEVGYSQVYQRQRTLTPGDAENEQFYQRWQSQHIDCIVVTSVEIFNTIVEGLPSCARPWLCSRLWVVVSERMGQHVRQWGIPARQIVNAEGAGDNIIAAKIQYLIENDYGATRQ